MKKGPLIISSGAGVFFRSRYNDDHLYLCLRDQELFTVIDGDEIHYQYNPDTEGWIAWPHPPLTLKDLKLAKDLPLPVVYKAWDRGPDYFSQLFQREFMDKANPTPLHIQRLSSRED